MKSILLFLPFLVILSIGLYPDSNVYAATDENIVGINYFDVVNPDGTHTWSSHHEYILDNGIYVPYVQNGLTVNSKIGDVTLNQDGSYTWNGKFTDKIVGKYADITNLNSWTYPNALNNDIPDVSFSNGEFTSSKLKSGVGLLEYKYIFIDGKWKTQLEATNLSGLTTKVFGFDQIINLNSDTIKFNNVTRNLDNFDGVIFDKTFLDNNQGKILDLLNGVHFDFDLGYENLYSITIHDTGANSSQLVFDYRTSTILLPNEILVIDPTFSFTSGATSAGLSATLRGYHNQIYNSHILIGEDINSFQFELKTAMTGTITAEIIDVDGVTVNETCGTLDTSTLTASFVYYTFTCSGTYALQSNDRIGFYVSGTNTGMVTQKSAADTDSGLRYYTKVSGTWGYVDTTEINMIVTYGVPPTVSPDAVDDLALSSVGLTTASLTFSQPNLNGESLFNYMLNMTTPQQGTIPTTFWMNTTSSPFLVTGLAAGTDYSASASVFTTAGIGNWTQGVTNILNFTTSSGASTPTGLTTTATSISTIDVNWNDAPAVDNLTGFRIFRESPTGNGWTLHTNDTASTTSFLGDTGLSTKTQYNYMVAGINGTGVGSNSTAAAATTYGVPDAISDLALGPTASTMTLTWSAPTVYGFPITGYKIEFESPVGGGYSVLVADTGTITTSYVHTGLASFTQYGYKVTAITSFGNSAASNEPSAYTVTNAPVLNLVNDCYHTCTTQLNLEWTAPTGTITGYKIEHNVNSGGYATLVANTTNTNVVYNATGLSAGDIVSYKVSAHSAFGTSIASNEKEYSTHKLPEAVDDLVATETLLSSIDLAWTQPTINSHILSCYNINYTTPLGDPQTIITACTPTTGVTYQITGLSLGDPNSFRVSAVTPHGRNATGNIINATAFSSFTIGELTIDENPNTNILSVLYDQVDTSSTSVVTVRFPNTSTNMTCNLNYKFANTDIDYTNLSPFGTYDADYDSYSFTLVNATNEIIDFDCYDATNTAINGQYTKPQTSFPFIDMANLFRDGVTFGTDGNFGGLDMITLIVIIVSMVGFNKSNPAAGLIISIMILGATSFFGLISMSASILGVLALIVMIGIVVTRK